MDSPRGSVISQNPVVEPGRSCAADRAGNHGGGRPGFPGAVTVTVLVLVLTVSVVLVLVLVLVLGEVVVGPVVVVEKVVEPAEVVEVVKVVVVSVVVEYELGVVELVVAAVRDVVVSGVNGLGPVLEPPKMKKTINASRNAPRAPKLTSAHGLRYQGSSGGGCWP
jgi:hypothetical protein